MIIFQYNSPDLFIFLFDLKKNLIVTNVKLRNVFYNCTYNFISVLSELSFMEKMSLVIVTFYDLILFYGIVRIVLLKLFVYCSR